MYLESLRKGLFQHVGSDGVGVPQKKILTGQSREVRDFVAISGFAPWISPRHWSGFQGFTLEPTPKTLALVLGQTKTRNGFNTLKKRGRVLTAQSRIGWVLVGVGPTPTYGQLRLPTANRPNKQCPRGVPSYVKGATSHLPARHLITGVGAARGIERLGVWHGIDGWVYGEK